MQKIALHHCCLFFEYMNKKFVYGITCSMLSSNYLIKYKPHFIIIPSLPYLPTQYGIFLHAGVNYILQKLHHIANKTKMDQKQQQIAYKPQRNGGVLDRLLKYSKMLYIDQQKMSQMYSHQQIFQLIQLGSITSFKQYQLPQQIIISVYIQQLAKQLEINYENNHNSIELLPWLNCPSYQLNLIVPQLGMTTYICQSNDIIAIDPTQQFIAYLKYNTVPKNKSKGSENYGSDLFSLLHTVIITKVACITAVLGLMVVENGRKIRVITAYEDLEQAIVQKGYKYLRIPEEVIRNRLLIRNISTITRDPNNKQIPKFPLLTNTLNPYILQSFSTLRFQFHPLSQSTQPKIELFFGSSTQISTTKRIIFYTQTPNIVSQLQPQIPLSQFPKDLTQNTVEHVIIYNINEDLLKQLKALPAQLRKKIILNRNQHKYNHKYFTTFEKNKIQYCTIIDTEYINLLNLNKTLKITIGKNFQDNQIKLKHDKNVLALENMQPGCKIYQMGDKAEMETIGHTIKIIDGFVLIQFMEDMKEKDRKRILSKHNELKDEMIRNSKKITAIKYAEIQIMMQKDCDIMIQTNNTIKNSQIYLKQFQQITFFTTAKSQIDHLATIQNNSLLSLLTAEQKHILNSLCQSIAFEVGQKININNQYVYFISKGAMKWQDSDKIAGNGCFIGNLSHYYQVKYSKQNEIGQEQESYIEIIKDTWALGINLEEFHQYFLIKYPNILYKMLCKGKIFN